MLNLNGEILGARSVKRPIALAQDYSMNLIVCGQFDTTVSGQNQTYSAVYKIDLVATSHQIDTAPIKRLLPRPIDLEQTSSRIYRSLCIF